MIIVFSKANVSYVLNLLGCTNIPLMIYVFPGYIFYLNEYTLRESSLINLKSKNIYFALAFAILGGILILLYSSMQLYNISFTY